MRPELHIITPVGRPQLLPRVAASLAASQLRQRFAVTWWVMYNAPAVPPGAAAGLSTTRAADTVITVPSPAPGLDATGRPAYGHAQRAHALDLMGDTSTVWTWVLDDDNLVHPDMAAGLSALIQHCPDARGFIVGQERADGAWFTPCSALVMPGTIDTAQYILRRDLIGAERIRPVYADDGGFIQRVFQAAPKAFVFSDTVLTYWNGQELIDRRA